MFRKSAVALVALFALAGATNNTPKTPKTPKTGGHAGGHSANQLTKLPNYQLCARSYPQYVAPQASQGAFTVPVSGGACASASETAGPVGVLSGVCGMNPYAGKQFTFYRVSTGGVDAFDIVGDGDCTDNVDGCYDGPYGRPQFQANNNQFPLIDNGDDEEDVQYLANEWCANTLNTNNMGQYAQTSACYGTLAVRGTPGPKNKYPGSELDLGWNTTTTYAYVGSTYTIDTQYGLAGTEDSSDRIFYLELWGYSVFSSITCQFIPVTITHTPATVYGGSGKYEKTPGAVVDPVTLTTARLTSSPAGVGNAYNTYQNSALNWQTNVHVNYIKKGGYLHYSLL